MDTKKGHDYRNLNIVSKRKRVVLYKHLSAPRPEIKKFNPLYVDQSNIYDAISISNIAQQSGSPSGGRGSWELIKLNDPTQGTGSFNRIGMSYSLKYLRIKGYLEANYKCEFKINFKLLLIRADFDLQNFHTFLNRYFYNYQFPSSWTDTNHNFSSDIERAAYGRHNYYKLVRNTDTWGIGNVVVRVLYDGTITNFPQMVSSTISVGSNPSISTTSNDGPAWNAYYPINLSVTVNDNIKVEKERYWMMLVTDQPIGYTRTTGSQGVTRSHAYTDRAFELNFFTLAYYTDS